MFFVFVFCAIFIDLSAKKLSDRFLNEIFFVFFELAQCINMTLILELFLTFNNDDKDIT